jgi:hypothetical protein
VWTTFGLQAMDFYWDISTLVVVLQPEWGALIMEASTLIVAINAMLLRRLRLRPPSTENAGAVSAATAWPPQTRDGPLAAP